MCIYNNLFDIVMYIDMVYLCYQTLECYSFSSLVNYESERFFEQILITYVLCNYINNIFSAHPWICTNEKVTLELLYYNFV